MAYVELYKKYRPNVWEDVIGQDAVVKSLKNAVAKNKVPVSYVFIGGHGCGKTTSAFILAKAINCENQRSGNPCNKCDSCVSIDEGTQPDVRYISMANNGGVDDIRQLTNEATLSPINIKRKVYILDEVHNLSKAAFDALLIPIEDKNMPAIFILCSTEKNKIPKTISSRSQERLFNYVSDDVLSQHVKKIANVENVDVTDNIVREAVRLGRGSVRDTLSALDTILETGDVSVFSVSEKLLQSLADKDLAGSLAAVSEGVEEGYDPKDLAESLFEDLSKVLLTISGVDSKIVGFIPVDDPISVGKKLYGRDGIASVAEIIGNSITEMKMGSDSKIYLGIALVQSIAKLKEIKKYLIAKKQRSTH